MLEIIRIQIARFQCLVGQDVVGELFDLKLNAPARRGGLDGLENLGMGAGDAPTTSLTVSVGSVAWLSSG